MTPINQITHEQLLDVLSYDELTGVFKWKKAPPTRPHYVGRVAGTVQQGYRRIKLFGTGVQAHRLALFYVNGAMPKGLVDHINGDGLDNRFVNLREATQQINSQNQRRPQKGNVSGYLGVHRKVNRYVAAIRVDGRLIHIGSFMTPEAAAEAYLNAKRLHHIGCAI